MNTRLSNTLLAILTLCIAPLHCDTPLILAIKNLDKSKVLSLLANPETKINKQDQNGSTPLHWAVIKRNKNLISLLLSKKAKINNSDKEGNTPLHIASINNFLIIAEHLIKNGAKLNKKNKQGWTSLHQASFMGYQTMCKLLIKNNAKTDIKTNKSHGGMMPIHLTAQKGQLKTLEILLKTTPTQIEIGTTNTLTPLHIATQFNQLDTVNYLLKQNARKDSTTKNGSTALHIATRHGQLQIAQLLIKQGAKQFSNNNMMTPLDLAYKFDRTNFVPLFIKQKKRTLITQTSTQTTIPYKGMSKNGARDKIHEAAESGDLNLLAGIINQYPTLLNHTNERKRTPLHIACIESNVSIVNFLLSLQADISGIDDSDRLPYNCATLYGHQHCADLIVAHAKTIGVTLPPLTLHESVALGDIKLLQSYLSNNGDINAKGFCSFSLLHVAVAGNNHGIAQLLINHGAQINAQDKWDYTPLHRAAHEGHIEVARMLLSKGTKIEARDQWNYTPLHRAAAEGKIEIVKLLLSKGAKIKACDKWNYTPLHRTTRYGHVEIARLLLSKGAKIEARDQWEYTPLHRAAHHGHVEVARMLLSKGAKIEARDQWNYTPLHRAADKGQAQIAALLLSKGANLEARDQWKNTPLHRAAREGRVKTAEVLISVRANLGARDEDNYTPLHMAAWKGQAEIAKLLIAKGAKLEAIDKNTMTPLHRAAKNGHIKTAKILIEAGAKVNVWQKNKKFLRLSPLNLAARAGHTLMVKLLLRHDAQRTENTKILAFSRESPLESAQKSTKQEIVNLIQNNNLIEILQCVDNKNVSRVKILINNGISKDYKNEFNQTLLHCAVKNNDIPMVKMLIDRQATTNALDGENQTPIHYAARSGNKEIAHLLIIHGAILNVLDDNDQSPILIAQENNNKNLVKYFKKITFLKLLQALKDENINTVTSLLISKPGINLSLEDGLTPLHIAVKKNNLELTELLLENNAQCNIPDKNGCTPIYYAIDHGNIAIVRLLIKHKVSFEQKNNDDQTPIDRARETGNKPLLSYLQKTLDIDLGISTTSSNPSFEFDINEPLKTGMILDDFIIDHTTITLGKKLGEGGFGEVYLGKWNAQDVAVKKLHSKSLSEKSKEEFKSETKIWSKLRHPNIAQLFGICVPPAPYCMIMPYKKHGSLYSMLQKNENLTWSSRKQLAIDIISALHYLHKKNILHRDLKSLNVLVSKEDNKFRAQLTDFGLSVVKQETTSSSKANNQHAAGTLLWMAPELLQGKSCSKTTDIWAYGMILLELATQKLPYHSSHPSVISSLIEKGRTPTIPTNTPSYFADLIRKCWQDPAKRPSAAQVLAYFDISAPIKDPNCDNSSINSTVINSKILDTGIPTLSSSVLTTSTGSRRSRRKPPKRSMMIKQNPLISQVQQLLDKAYPNDLAANSEDTLQYRNEILQTLSECKTLSNLPERLITELEEIKTELSFALEDDSLEITNILKS